MTLVTLTPEPPAGAIASRPACSAAGIFAWHSSSVSVPDGMLSVFVEQWLLVAPVCGSVNSAHTVTSTLMDGLYKPTGGAGGAGGSIDDGTPGQTPPGHSRLSAAPSLPWLMSLHIGSFPERHASAFLPNSSRCPMPSVYTVRPV